MTSTTMTNNMASQFFDVPFLLLKKRTLQTQLANAEADLSAAGEKLQTAGNAAAAIRAPSAAIVSYESYSLKYDQMRYF